eukprot:354102-Chlamydomonas_euryale.AAC.2
MEERGCVCVGGKALEALPSKHVCIPGGPRLRFANQASNVVLPECCSRRTLNDGLTQTLHAKPHRPCLQPRLLSLP